MEDAMTSFAPTDEQQAIIDAYRRGENLVVNAYAGTGKTTMLRMLAQADPRRRFVYVAYNRAARDEAKDSFPVNARSYTSHGLAYRPMIHMAKRIGGPKYIRGIELAKLMKITAPARLTPNRVLAPGQLASVVKATILRFCYSADEKITGWNVPRDLKRFTDDDEIAALRKIVPPIAQRVWDEDINTADGKLPMEHDYYLKAYALTHPQLPGDVITLDEAQDSNPCVAAMIREQAQYGTQLVMVGDTYQAIYGWRGAVDAMADFGREPGVTVLSLTQSFRFGPEIAREGNKWLQILGAPKPLRGFEKIQSRIGQIPGKSADAVLCRTNAEALRRAIAALGDGLKVAFPKGTGELMALVKGAADIKAGRPSEHPDLMAFATWGQVQDYVESEADGADLKQFVDLVDQYGTDELFVILSQIGSAAKGVAYDVLISTAHGAKGLEWPLVLIADDFLEPKKDPEAPAGSLPKIPRELAMLAYVAVTRAKNVLNPDGLSWVNKYLPDGDALDLDEDDAPADDTDDIPEGDDLAALAHPATARAMALAQI
jgi:superfamily I DNA/RNA helicase